MAKTPEISFDAPIAGQSLTTEVGNRPWQQPPRYSTVEEAIEHYIPRLTEEDAQDQLLDVLEMGVPVTTIANSLQIGGVMQGLHSVDVGMLVMPVIMEMVAFIADDADIEYTMGTEKEVDTSKVSDTKIALAMKKARDKKNNGDEPKEMSLEELVGEEEMATPKSGLMARRA